MASRESKRRFSTSGDGASTGPFQDHRSSVSSSSTVRSYVSVVSSVSRGVSTVSTSSAVLGDVCDVSSCPPDLSDLISFPPLSSSSVSDVCGVTSARTVSHSDVFDVHGVVAAASARTVSTSSVSDCTCVQCGLVCKSKRAVRMHQFRVHSKKSSSSTVSSISMSTDVSAVTTASSTNTVHSSAVSPENYTCVQCALVCKSKQALHMHHIRFHREKNTSTQCSSTQQQHSISSTDAADVHVHSAVKSPQPKCVE